MLSFDVHLLSKFTALLLAILQLEATGKLLREDTRGKRDPRFMERRDAWDTAAFTTARPPAHILLLVMTTAKWPLYRGGKGDKNDQAKGTYHLVMLSQHLACNFIW